MYILDNCLPPAGGACWEGCHFIGNPALDEGAPFFRKTFTLPEGAVRGTIFLCGVGFHELYVNGVKAGDSVLTPAQTAYDRRAYYCRYDVAALLKKGGNTVYVILGNGLYNCGITTWDYEKAPWRSRPKLCLYGEIVTRDGERVCLRSDTSFETGESAITYNSFYGGETQDYTRGLPHEAPPGAATRPAVIVRGPGGLLSLFPEPHVKERDTLPPVKQTKLSDGRVLYDFGVNMAGWLRVDAAAKAGAAGRTRFTLRYGERLSDSDAAVSSDDKKDGRNDVPGGLDTRLIDVFAGGRRFQTDEYILDAEHPVRDGRPHFSYHGFRYVEMKVEEGELADLSLRAVQLSSDLARIGRFSCSDDRVNRINELGQRATRSNLVNVPTDCPHREKNGWTGDIALSAEQICLNLDAREFFQRWLADMRDVQRPSGQLPGIVPTGGWGFNWGSGPVWDSALFELPLAVYHCYGDPLLLIENGGAMKRYMDFCASMAEDYVVNFGLGDWCPPSGGAAGRFVPEIVSDTATYFRLAGIMALTADLMGQKTDAKYFRDLGDNIKDAFHRHFVDDATGVVRGDCQTGQGMALALGLLEGETRRKAEERLLGLIAENHGRLDFGILGAKYVFEALSLAGHGQTALDMILHEGYPSYRHWLDTGATTMAESWNRDASDNHHMFSDVCRWFFRYVAGLARPDFARCAVTFTPDFLAPLTSAQARTETPAGVFSCAWERQSGSVVVTATAPRDFAVSLAPGGGAVFGPPEKRAAGVSVEYTWR